MALKKTELLVLKRTRIQESSLYLICLTRDCGKIPLVAKSAVRPGSASAESLQYFAVADVVFYQNEKEAADYISKAELVEAFDNIAGNEQKFGYGSAALEFANLFLPEHEVNSQVYFILKKFLRSLDTSEEKDFRREILHFWYLLCIFCGYAPELGQCVQCGDEITGDRLMLDPERGGLVCARCVGNRLVIPLDRGTVKVLEKLSGTDISDNRKVSLSVAQLEQIRQMLTALTEYHLGKRADLKSFDFLRKLDIMKQDGGIRGENSR
jgi:DNA repair protein RecO (recombination protein O)